MKDKKVVITGMSMISSLGMTLDENWENLLAGKSGVKNITLFDASKNRTRFAAQITEDIEEKSKEVLSPLIRKQMTRVTRMGYLSAVHAVNDSTINFDNCDRDRCAVITGVVSNAHFHDLNDFSKKHFIIKEMTNALGAWVSIRYKLKGPCYPISVACASSAYAIGTGFDLIMTDKADVVIIGGSDSHIDTDRMEGFNELFALSSDNESYQTASRPFSKTRSGFVMGEGAGFMVLESEEHAKKRGARIYAEIAGYAMTSEANNIVSPESNGAGMAKTIGLALAHAHMTGNDIDYINAHGTSTYLNDKYETQAIKDVFKESAYKIAVSSSKSMIGHTLGACGVIEAVITAKSVYHQKITPTINYFDPDPELDLDYTPNISKNKEIDCAISNSFGFGGHNCTIVLKKYNMK